MSWQDSTQDTLERSDFVPDSDVEVDDDFSDESADETAPESSSSGETATRKPRRRVGAAGSLTKNQVLLVMHTMKAVAGASQGARSILASVFRSTDEVEDLTVSLVTSKPGAADPLSDLVELRAATEENQLKAAAMVAGMEPKARARVHQILAAVTGDDAELPKDDMSASVHLVQTVMSLTDGDSNLINEAVKLRG